MAWRKWIVRGLVLVCTLALGLGFYFFRYWTDPELIRQKVIGRLENDLLNVRVSLNSARMRLFGGITLSELRIARRGSLEETDFLLLPSGILYHDKEQLLDGQLALRKVELYGPQLHLVRNRKGQWNLSGLMRPSAKMEQLPGMIIKQGSLVLVDRYSAPSIPPVEIRQIHLTTVNDPITEIRFEGSGECNLLGTIRLQGKYDRQSGAFHLTLVTPTIPINAALTQHIASYLPEMREHFQDLRGLGSFSVDLHYEPGSSEPFSYDVTTEIKQGSWSHPALPWKLHNLSLLLRCRNGTLSHVDLKAKADQTQLQLRCEGMSLADVLAGANWYAAEKATLTAKHLHVDGEFYHKLPKPMQEYLRNYVEAYSPAGTMSAQFVCQRLTRDTWRRHLTLEAENMSATYHLFPYLVENIKGKLNIIQIGPPPPTVTFQHPLPVTNHSFRDEDELNNLVTMDIQGKAAGQLVTLKGTARGPFATSKVQVRLSGKNLPINQTLMNALPKNFQQITEAFEPMGLIDFDIDLSRKPGTLKIFPTTRIHLHDARIKYNGFPLALKRASGTLELLPDHWEVRDFVGYHKSGRILVSGRSFPGESPKQLRLTSPWTVSHDDPERLQWDDREPANQQKAKVRLRIEAQDLPLDKDFEEALAPGRAELASAWKTFAITGKMSFVAMIEDLPDRPRDLNLTMTVGGCRMKPSFFPYSLQDVSCTAHYHADSIQFSKFRGRHGTSELLVDQGTVLLKKEGGFWMELKNLRGKDLIVDQEFLEALPRALREACAGLNLKEPINTRTRLVIDEDTNPTISPTIYWNTSISLDKANIQTGVELNQVNGTVSCTGLYKENRIQDIVGRLFLKEAKVFNQPLKNMTARFAVWKDTPDILRIWDLQSELFGGIVGGQVRIEFGSIFRYEVILKAIQVQLEKFGQYNLGKDAELSGQFMAGVYLKGKGRDLNGLTGNGTIDVPDGKMYRLPLVLDLLKWLGLRVPDRTAFEQAHIRFNIEGPRVNVEELDLFGNAISVRGKGSLRLDGTDLNLTLNADWGRLSQFLPPGLDKVTQSISNQLLKIKVTGKVSEVKFDKELVPIFTNPIKKVWRGIQGAR